MSNDNKGKMIFVPHDIADELKDYIKYEKRASFISGLLLGYGVATIIFTVIHCYF